MLVKNLPEDAFDAVEYLTVRNRYITPPWGVGAYPHEQQYWLELTRMNKGMMVVFYGWPMDLYMIPPHISRSRNDSSLTKFVHTIIYAGYDNVHPDPNIILPTGTNLVFEYYILQVNCKSGVILKTPDEIATYFFPSYGTLVNEELDRKRERGLNKRTTPQ